MRKTFIPVKGDQYGIMKLTGAYFIGVNGVVSEVVCECGNIFYTRFADVRKDRIKSCGCKTKELGINANTKHGLSKPKNRHPLYTIWAAIKQRCLNKKFHHYNDYGGRGISICEEWNKSFISFYEWAIANGWATGLTIDRENNNGNYEPSNCRFVTMSVQSTNRRSNIFITAFGEKKCLTEWVRDNRCTVSFYSLKYRIEKGWNAEAAITTKSRNKKSVYIQIKKIA